jgi:hypothetical protein
MKLFLKVILYVLMFIGVIFSTGMFLVMFKYITGGL